MEPAKAIVIDASFKDTTPALAPTTEPLYFRQNWMRLLASDCKPHLAFVRVWDGVGSITNGRVLLRTEINVPNGFYQVAVNGDLIVAGGHKGIENPYPDVESIAPPFTSLKPFCQMNRDTVGLLMNFAEEARRRDHTVVFDRAEAYSVQWGRKTKQPEESLVFPYPFGIPGEEVFINALYLKLALIEMLRYDWVCIAKEPRTLRDETPLVIGRNWKQCALIMTAKP